MNKSELKPAVVFEQFAKINEIPRPSKREEKMIEYLKDFGKSHDLETVVDEVGNVIIRKGATPGYEDCKTVILQSHMDMVCDCLPDVKIDFDKDEETGLTGAFGMKADFMRGDFLINLDSEDEGEIFVSCAGGRTTTAQFEIQRQPAPEGYFFIKGSVKGLVGGHSGDDINKKRANGLKIIARFVYQEMERYEDIHLVRLHGGSLHNAIPRGGYFVLAVPNNIKENIRADWNIFSAQVNEEFHVCDQQMVWRMRSYDPEPMIDDGTARRFVYALQAVDNGVYAVCQDEALGGMTETSSNLARVETYETTIDIMTSQRSNVMSNLDNMCNTVAAVFKLAGAKVTFSEGYPAWKMRTNSELQNIVKYTYHKLFQKDPTIKGIHAGLECGLFAERYPNLDMVSMGPTLRDVHTPDERLLIPTVQMVWDHLLLTLKSMPHQL